MGGAEPYRRQCVLSEYMDKGRLPFLGFQGGQCIRKILTPTKKLHMH